MAPAPAEPSRRSAAGGAERFGDSRIARPRAIPGIVVIQERVETGDPVCCLIGVVRKLADGGPSDPHGGRVVAVTMERQDSAPRRGEADIGHPPSLGSEQERRSSPPPSQAGAHCPREAESAWTQLFGRASAVVTDVGSALSHASIIAREYGIPAVVGCGDATVRLHDGQRVGVDGAAGLVEVARGT